MVNTTTFWGNWGELGKSFYDMRYTSGWGIFFAFFLCPEFLEITVVGQTPPFVPDECLKGNFDDCVLDCPCSWCYSTAECLPFVKARGQCKNHTAKTHECKQKEAKNEKGALIFTGALAGCAALALFVGVTVWFCSCPDFKKYWRRLRPGISSKGGYEYLL